MYFARRRAVIPLLYRLHCHKCRYVPRRTTMFQTLPFLDGIQYTSLLSDMVLLWCTNLGRQVGRATGFFNVVPNICG
jgi:hypothetical protein